MMLIYKKGVFFTATASERSFAAEETSIAAAVGRDER